VSVASLHRWLGAAACLVFLGTGVFLFLRLEELAAGNPEVRWLYRANHIYILLGGLLNLAVGLYAGTLARGWRGRAQAIGSALLLASLPLLIAAFLLEPRQANPQRPLTEIGIVALAAGTLLHVPARRSRRDPA
jgi:hypothetical protein